MMIEKQKLREKLAKRIRELQLHREREQVFLDRLLTIEAYRQAGIVFCYVSVDKEPDTLPILENIMGSGKKLCVPKCLAYGKMKAYALPDLSLLREGKYGIPEPAANLCEVMPDEIDFAVIPCLTANARGARLGHGAGYYDRFMAGTGMVKTVLCRENMIETEIPMGSYDVCMDYLVTEAGVTKCSG